jgi:hypothetical protein
MSWPRIVTRGIAVIAGLVTLFIGLVGLRVILTKLDSGRMGLSFAIAMAILLLAMRMTTHATIKAARHGWGETAGDDTDVDSLPKHR